VVIDVIPIIIVLSVGIRMMRRASPGSIYGGVILAIMNANGRMIPMRPPPTPPAPPTAADAKTDPGSSAHITVIETKAPTRERIILNPESPGPGIWVIIIGTVPAGIIPSGSVNDCGPVHMPPQIPGIITCINHIGRVIEDPDIPDIVKRAAGGNGVNFIRHLRGHSPGPGGIAGCVPDPLMAGIKPILGFDDRIGRIDSVTQIRPFNRFEFGRPVVGDI